MPTSTDKHAPRSTQFNPASGLVHVHGHWPTAGGIPQGITLASDGGEPAQGATVDILAFSSDATAKGGPRWRRQQDQNVKITDFGGGAADVLGQALTDLPTFSIPKVRPG